MAKTQERKHAVQLRQIGWSLKEIAAFLGVKKSTTSYWCKDIELSSAQKQRLVQKSLTAGIAAFHALAEQRRNTRALEIKKMAQLGKQDVGTMTQRDRFVLGLGLYWSEGYRKGNQEVGFTNSDPAIIKVAVRWFREAYRIQKKDLILRISINDDHSHRRQLIQQYWARVTGCSEEQFTKASIIHAKTKKQFPHPENYFGVLRIKVRRGANLKRRILGSLAALS
mgnify:CR=1 FL=1